MEHTFGIGDRVQIASDHHWAQGAFGTIEHSAWPGASPDACSREVSSLQGTLVFYSVRFDEPQTDGEGESGYTGGEIDSRYLAAAPSV
jgi:hypothetical protein